MVKKPVKIPNLPGVYFFKDQKGCTLYIGKAANLKNRLRWYLGNDAKEFRIAKMLETATDLDWQETGSEIEALILESRLIKKHRPPFNIRLRDDKQYFFVGITKEEFSKIFLTHQPKSSKSAIHPLENSRAKSRGLRVGRMADLLKVNYIGPFTDGASLKTTLKLLRRIFSFCTCKQKHHRFCLNYHIGNCLGFCCLKDMTMFRSHEIWSIYQKNIGAIKDILNGKRTSVLKNLKKEMEKSAKQGKFEKAIESRNKINQLKRVFANAKVIKEFAKKEKTLTEMQKLLNLPSLPHRIEGYDISNIQGQFAVGSMVVFTNGHLDKNEYRKFKIRISGHSDDVGMLKEIFSRRFNHPEWPFPDLIVVDGGKGQLSAALSIVPKNISVIALAKDRKHNGHHIFSNILPLAKASKSKEKKAVPLSSLPDPIKNLILQIDSEAHRLAINYYRKLHNKTLKTPKFST